MSKLKCQIKSKAQMSRIFNFELWHSFDICLPAAGRDFEIRIYLHHSTFLSGHDLFNLYIDLPAGEPFELGAGRWTGSGTGPTSFTNHFIDLTDFFVFQISNGFIGADF